MTIEAPTTAPRAGADVLDGVLGQLAAAIDVLAEAELSGRVGPELIALEGLRARLDAQIARRLVAFDRSVEYSLSGHRSTASWLTDRCRVSALDAHGRVRVARQVAECEVTRAAWEAGRIHSRHVEVLTRTRHAAKADAEFGEFEPSAVRVAEVAGPEDVATVCTRWRAALDAARAADPAAGDPAGAAEQRFERRGLHASETLDGMVAVDGMLDADTGEVVLTALETAMDQTRVNDDPRSLPQLRADALGAICEHFLSHREPGTNRPHIVVHSDPPTLSGEAVGLCVTERGTVIDPATAQMWACDAIVQHVVMDGAVPLALGRATRTFTPAQLRAMAARDLGCRWPGCNQPPTRCQGHHVQWWERDLGPTDLDNGILLCRFHHRQIHTGRYRLTRSDGPDEPHTFDVHGPGDILIGRSRPPTRDPAIPTRARRRTRERDLERAPTLDERTDPPEPDPG